MVYLLARTGALDGYLADIESVFQQLRHDHRTTPNLRVAALKHGAYNTASTIIPGYVRTLGAPSYRPYNPFGPHLFGPGFKAPAGISAGDVTNAVKSLYSKSGPYPNIHPYLYPGIELAREMIETECNLGPAPPMGAPAPTSTSTPTPTLTPAPWCQRKVIVILHDGNPGSAHESSYRNPVATIHNVDEPPSAMMDRVVSAGIELRTLCASPGCNHKIVRYRRAWGYYNGPSCYSTTDIFCLNLKGEEILEKLAERTRAKGIGGKHYGQVP